VKPHSSPGRGPRLHSSTINRSPTTYGSASATEQDGGRAHGWTISACCNLCRLATCLSPLLGKLATCNSRLSYPVGARCQGPPGD
jgi:hypothetical protein